MLRHYVALALRNIARAKLYTAISVVGLAIGFGAAALTLAVAIAAVLVHMWGMAGTRPVNALRYE